MESHKVARERAIAAMEASNTRANELQERNSKIRVENERLKKFLNTREERIEKEKLRVVELSVSIVCMTQSVSSVGGR